MINDYIDLNDSFELRRVKINNLFKDYADFEKINFNSIGSINNDYKFALKYNNFDLVEEENNSQILYFSPQQNNFYITPFVYNNFIFYPEDPQNVPENIHIYLRKSDKLQYIVDNCEKNDLNYWGNTFNNLKLNIFIHNRNVANDINVFIYNYDISYSGMVFSLILYRQPQTVISGRIGVLRSDILAVRTYVNNYLIVYIDEIKNYQE